MASCSRKPRKLCQYSEEMMQAAIHTYKDKNNNLGLRKVAKLYGVPSTTLATRASGKHSMRKVQKTVLTPDKEESLVSWIEESDNQGFEILTVPTCTTPTVPSPALPFSSSHSQNISPETCTSSSKSVSSLVALDRLLDLSARFGPDRLHRLKTLHMLGRHTDTDDPDEQLFFILYDKLTEVLKIGDSSSRNTLATVNLPFPSRCVVKEEECPFGNGGHQ